MISSKNIGLIVAVDLNGLIGVDNIIPWKNSTDLKRFKQLTLPKDGKQSILFMGRKTYDSLPPNKLPNRIKWVISSEKKQNTEDTKWFNDYCDVLTELDNTCNSDLWIIGGVSIYKWALDINLPSFLDISIINKLHLSTSFNKVYFPAIPFSYIVESEIQSTEDPILYYRKYIRR